MPAALIGKKLGMTRYFLEDGSNIPVTVIEAGPCNVTQVKNSETDGYAAVQIGYGDIKPRRSSFPVIGHDAKAGVSTKRWHRELRLVDDKAAEEFQPGQSVDVKAFENVKYVDIVAVSKGKGFAGTMKRHNFKGLCASHGTERKHRSAGSIAAHGTNRGTGPKPKKGKRMAGQLGNERVTSRSMDVVAVQPEKNLLLVKGTVPGPNDGMVFIREAIRLNRRKARLAKQAEK